MSILRLPFLRRKRQLERKGPANKKRRQGDQTKTQKVRVPLSRRLTVVLSVVILWALLAFTLTYRPYHAPDFLVGMTSQRTVIAEVDFQYVDKDLTRAERQRAVAKVPRYYAVQPEAG